MKALKFALIAAIGCTGLSISSYSNSDSLIPANVSASAWADSIAIALKSDHLIRVDGEVFIVDSIPCATSASHSIFDRILEHVYVDCSTCKQASGKARKDSWSYCTNVRRYE